MECYEIYPILNKIYTYLLDVFFFSILPDLKNLSEFLILAGLRTFRSILNAAYNKKTTQMFILTQNLNNRYSNKSRLQS